MIGFDSLSIESLESLIETYQDGLESDTTYPCGGSRRTVKRWLAKAEIVLEQKLEAKYGVDRATAEYGS